MARPKGSLNNQIKTKPLIVEEVKDVINSHDEQGVREAVQDSPKAVPQVADGANELHSVPPAKVPTVVKKKQFELSDTDFEILNQGQYSKAAWDYIGRRHSIDPDSRESLGDRQGRAFLAFPKKWVEEPPKSGGVLTTKNINAVSIHPSDIGSIRSSLHARDLTKPEAEAIATEQV